MKRLRYLRICLVPRGTIFRALSSRGSQSARPESQQLVETLDPWKASSRVTAQLGFRERPPLGFRERPPLGFHDNSHYAAALHHEATVSAHQVGSGRLVDRQDQLVRLLVDPSDAVVAAFEKRLVLAHRFFRRLDPQHSLGVASGGMKRDYWLADDPAQVPSTLTDPFSSFELEHLLAPSMTDERASLLVSDGE
jgi:hypothetical protein